MSDPDLTFSRLSEAEVTELAERLAACTLPRDVAALWGDLGAGKTTFARAFIRRFLERPEDAPSPTFTLVQSYEGDRGSLYHFDAYRLKDPDEIWEIGLEEALIQSVVLVEWPERLGTNLPARRLDIRLEDTGSSDTRRITITASGNSDWLTRYRSGMIA